MKDIDKMTCKEIREVVQELQYDLETYFKEKINEYNWLIDGIKIKTFDGEIYISFADVFEIIPDINLNKILFENENNDK